MKAFRIYLLHPINQNEAIAGYSAGHFDGVRAAKHLRGILAEPGIPAIPPVHPFPKVQDNFNNDGIPTD